MTRAWLVLALAACGPSAAPAPASEAAELEPDPITRPLSEDEVRGEAVRLATRAFDEQHFVDALGAPAHASFDPAELIVERDGARWRCEVSRPAGATMHVTMGAFGESPTVEVDFATE